jgi:hypothetical protein
MIELLRLILHIMASLFKPRAKLVAEILVLRQQREVRDALLHHCDRGTPPDEATPDRSDFLNFLT